MPARGSLSSTLFSLLFALIPLGIGVVLAILSVRHYLASQDVLYSAIVSALVFGGFGVHSLRGVVRERQSREARSQPVEVRAVAEGLVPAGGYRARGQGALAEEVYGEIAATLPLPELPPRPDPSSPRSLSLRDRRAGWFELGFALVWNGFTFPIFVGAVATGNLCVAAFLSVFVGVGVLVGHGAVRRVLARRKLPEISLSEEPVYLGGSTSLRIVQRGPANIVRYGVTLRCEEHVEYTVGTDTRTESHEIFSRALLEDEVARLGVNDRRVFEIDLEIPADGPCSFQSAHNEVAWVIAVHAEIAGWPDYDESFTFRALPRIPS